MAKAMTGKYIFRVRVHKWEEVTKRLADKPGLGKEDTSDDDTPGQIDWLDLVSQAESSKSFDSKLNEHKCEFEVKSWKEICSVMERFRLLKFQEKMVDLNV
jgi:hypothetical protein